MNAAPRRASARRGVLRPLAVAGVVAGVLLGVAACSSDGGSDAASACPDDVSRGDLDSLFTVSSVRIESDAGDTDLCVAVADTASERAQGLMGVTDLGDLAGMLFVWDEETAGSFHMENTPTPLSIAWFATDGSVVSTADMEPCLASAAGSGGTGRPDCPSYPSGGLYLHALEVPQGDLESIGVTDDPSVRLDVG